MDLTNYGGEDFWIFPVMEPSVTVTTTLEEAENFGSLLRFSTKIIPTFPSNCADIPDIVIEDGDLDPGSDSCLGLSLFIDASIIDVSSKRVRSAGPVFVL